MSLVDERTLDDSGPHDSDSGGSMFRQASDIHIHGGTFNVFGSGGRDRTEQKKRIADAMAVLSSRAEQGAPYDAAAREDVPKCHEHTRVAIMEGVHKWAHSQEPDACPLMWMYGPAGSGKTTIMQTVAETLDKEGSLAASFFFSRLSTGRPREKKNFVITLAHQLSLCIPALHQVLAAALSNSSILTKSLAKQMDALVIGPLSELGVDQIRPCRIFLVDGLDECNGDTAQRDILSLLEEFTRHSRHSIRILVASRSLSHIRGFFSQAKIAGMTATMPLDNNYQSNKDVKAFLDSEFAKIRDEHPSRGGLPSQWPLDRDVKALVARASGQFIYASVVMKFIAGHGRHPAESLQTIIDLKAGSGARPHEELDAVYAQVLSTIETENVEFVQTLMGCLLLDAKYTIAQVVQKKATNHVDSFFMLHAGTTEARINRIYPLITTKPDGGLQFAHASFPDYLLDGSRSMGFVLDMRKVHCSLACHWLEWSSAYFKRCQDGRVSIGSPVGDWASSIPDEYIAMSGSINGQILLQLLYHCLEAEWTPRLRRDILTFDVCAALKFDSNRYSQKGEKLSGWALVCLLNLTFWAEQHHCLSSAETENLRGCIQSELLGLSLPLADRRIFATLLTWFRNFDIYTGCRSMNQVSKPFQAAVFARFLKPQHIFGDDILQASCIWLCQILVPGMTMNGSFFSDGNLYAELTLQYAYSISPGLPYDTDIPILLSKASPSKELASFLVENALELPNITFAPVPLNNLCKEHFFMAVFIYLFECGIPFHSEHRHRQESNSEGWTCGICLLFDPLRPDFLGIELSRDPAVKPVLQPVHIADGEVPQALQINPVLQPIPRLPLLWLQAWIMWLADTMTRFFPVVA